MPAMFILNPYANRWLAGQRKDEAHRAPYGSVRTELRLTERPGHRTELAYEAAIDGCSPNIAAGDSCDQGPWPDGRRVGV
jgi:hypothetical protein